MAQLLQELTVLANWIFVYSEHKLASNVNNENTHCNYCTRLIIAIAMHDTY